MTVERRVEWEYRIEDFAIDADRGYREMKLNDYGRDGWELVATTAFTWAYTATAITGEGSEKRKIEFILKRPVSAN